MKIGASITLDRVEQGLAKAIAQMRHNNNRSESVTNAKIGPQSNEDTDLEGIGGELAFCKLFNTYPDLSVETRSSLKGSDNADAVKDGKTIDIKTTKYENGKLVAAPWKKQGKKPDYFALMTGTFPVYTFRGFMKSDELLKDSRLGSLGHGPTDIALQSELKEFLLG